MSLGGVTGSQMRFFGLGSGLDVDDIVSKLMAAERIPLDKLVQRRQLLEWKQEDYRSMNRLLRDLDSALFSLRLTSTFNPRSTTSSDETIVTATAAAGAPEGVYEITVDSLARAVHFSSSAAITTGAGTDTLADQFGLTSAVSFTITNAGADGGNGVTRTFTFQPTDSIDDVVAQINSSNLELQAFYDPDLDRFFLSSEATGDAANLTFTDTDNFLQNTLKLVDESGASLQSSTPYVGQNAVFDLNGAQNLTKPTNEFTINGVTYTLNRADPATKVTIKVSHDIDAVIASVKGFVDKYNEVISAINAELTERRYYDYPPLTDAQKKEMTEDEIKLWEEKARSGMLRSDTLLTGVLSDLRRALSDSVSGIDSKYRSLSAIGITSGSWFENGKLYLDETKLRQALEEDPDAVTALFTQNGASYSEDGIGIRLNDVLDRGIEQIGERAGSETAAVDQSALGDQIQFINEQIERWEDRLLRREEYYYSQFTALETFMSQMNTQALWFAQQFGGGQA